MAELIERKREFAESVKINHAPKLKIKSEES